MDIRPLDTETDYQAALAEIERLFDATANTPEGDRLEVLATLVEAYESNITAFPPQTPSKRSSTTWTVAGSAAVTWSLSLESCTGSGMLNRKRPVVPGHDPASPYRVRYCGRDSHPTVPPCRTRDEQGRATDAGELTLCPGFPARLTPSDECLGALHPYPGTGPACTISSTNVAGLLHTGCAFRLPSHAKVTHGGRS